MKKISKLLMPLLMATMLLPGCSGSNSTTKVYKIKITNGNLSISTKLNFDYNYFLGDNQRYSKDLSNIALALANDGDDSWSTEITNGSIKKDNFQDKEAIYKEFDCKDFVKVDLDGSKYEEDLYDTNRLIMAHHEFEKDENKYDVVFIAYAMTGPQTEWISNLDVGAENEGYYVESGVTHSYWKNKSNHKGFDVAANRTYEYIDEYLENKVSQDSNTKKILFFSGYSRGAALANIAVNDYNLKNSNDEYKIFGYTFSTPNTICANVTGTDNNKNLFNIVNEDRIGLGI